MSKHRDLNPGQAMPSGHLDAINEFLSTLPGGNFVLSSASATSVQVVAGAGAAQAVIGLGGQLRFNSATTSAAHPGGAAGTHDVWATSRALVTSQEDAGTFDYSFLLKITTSGTPSGTGTEAVYRKVGTVTWSGTAITGIHQLPGAGGVTDAQVAAANKDGAAGTPSMRTLGSGSTQAAVGADFATHAAATTGVHGIPAMASGQGLLWNGSTWVATDLATQAELAAHEADTTSVHGIADTANVLVRTSGVVAGNPGTPDSYVTTVIAGNIVQIPLVGTD